jgi:Mono-functional DNA-alkylating methyl methanesulfonate N-term
LRDMEFAEGPWSQSNVEMGASMIIPVPTPLGGVLVIGEETIAYINGCPDSSSPSPSSSFSNPSSSAASSSSLSSSSTSSSSSSLASSYAPSTTSTSLSSSLSSGSSATKILKSISMENTTTMSSYNIVDPDGSRWLLGDRVGRLFLLILQHVDGRVTQLQLEPLGTTSIR